MIANIQVIGCVCHVACRCAWSAPSWTRTSSSICGWRAASCDAASCSCCSAPSSRSLSTRCTRCRVPTFCPWYVRTCTYVVYTYVHVHVCVHDFTLSCGLSAHPPLSGWRFGFRTRTVWLTNYTRCWLVCVTLTSMLAVYLLPYCTEVIIEMCKL